MEQLPGLLVDNRKPEALVQPLQQLAAGLVQQRRVDNGTRPRRDALDLQRAANCVRLAVVLALEVGILRPLFEPPEEDQQQQSVTAVQGSPSWRRTDMEQPAVQECMHRTALLVALQSLCMTRRHSRRVNQRHSVTLLLRPVSSLGFHYRIALLGGRECIRGCSRLVVLNVQVHDILELPHACHFQGVLRYAALAE